VELVVAHHHSSEKRKPLVANKVYCARHKDSVKASGDGACSIGDSEEDFGDLDPLGTPFRDFRSDVYHLLMDQSVRG
jgi:hypothetical protein